MIVKSVIASVPTTDCVLNGMTTLYNELAWKGEPFVVFKFEKEATKYMYPICKVLYPNCSVEIGDDCTWSADVYIDDKCEGIVTGSTV